MWLWGLAGCRQPTFAGDLDANRGEFVCGDASNPQFRSRHKVPTRFFPGVLHHLTDKQIGEMLALARHFTSGGRFILYVPCFRR